MDVAALEAAKQQGLQTGGVAARGWKTQDGPRPYYAQMYGMVECDRPGYKERTWDNVQLAEATLRVALFFSSPGDRCTRAAIKHFRRPFLDVQLDVHDGVWSVLSCGGVHDGQGQQTIAQVTTWLQDFKVVNVAGNSESTAPGIQLVSYNLLSQIFNRVQIGNVRT